MSSNSAVDVGRRFDADDEVEFAVDQVVEQLRPTARRAGAGRRRVGRRGTAQRVGEVEHGGGVDHPEPDARRRRPCVARSAQSGEVAGEAEHLAGVGEHGRGRRRGRAGGGRRDRTARRRAAVRARRGPARAPTALTPTAVGGRRPTSARRRRPRGTRAGGSERSGSGGTACRIVQTCFTIDGSREPSLMIIGS